MVEPSSTSLPGFALSAHSMHLHCKATSGPFEISVRYRHWLFQIKIFESSSLLTFVPLCVFLISVNGSVPCSAASCQKCKSSPSSVPRKASLCYLAQLAQIHPSFLNSTISPKSKPRSWFYWSTVSAPNHRTSPLVPHKTNLLFGGCIILWHPPSCILIKLLSIQEPPSPTPLWAWWCPLQDYEGPS